MPAIGIVDDHPLFRLGLRAALERRPGLDVVGEAGTLADALALAERVELLTVDLGLADSSGFNLIEQLTARGVRAKILVISMLDECLYAERCVRAGASGYLAKRDAPERLLHAVDRVLGGDVFLGPAVLQRMARRLAGGGQAADPLDGLTARELEVFRLIGAGCSGTRIARTLGISPKTVETHQAKLQRKLGISGMLELRRLATSWALDGRIRASAK